MENIEVSKRITELRQAKGYTVNKLAIRAGISQSFLREIELGSKKPTVETLSSICWALDIKLKDFFDTEQDVLLNDLTKEVYRLEDTQRQKLLDFLRSL